MRANGQSPGVSRNRVISLGALCVFAVGGGPGTANELLFAWLGGVRAFGLKNPPAPEGLAREHTWGVDQQFTEHDSLQSAVQAFDKFVEGQRSFQFPRVPPR